MHSNCVLSEASAMEEFVKLGIVRCFNIFLLGLLSATNLAYAQINKPAKPLVSAMYVFGDSTVDPGNNNVLPTIGKANFPPYGRDFVDHKPTGRFTNGKLGTDFLSGLVGLPDILPAYLDPEFQGRQILTGASFASAGSGYDEVTTFSFGVLPLRKQLENFKHYRGRLANMTGKENASKIISRGLFGISMGTNDFVINYYSSYLLIRKIYTVTQFQDLLIRSLLEFIQHIYKEGATKLFIVGLPPFGCLPSQITMHNLIGNTCVEEYNNVAISFNKKIVSLLHTLKPTLPGLKIVYVDIYDKLLDIIQHPKIYGFEEVRSGCCGTGLSEYGYTCNALTRTCPDASKFVFWDSFHPTDHAYTILAQSIFSQILSLF